MKGEAGTGKGAGEVERRGGEVGTGKGHMWFGGLKRARSFTCATLNEAIRTEDEVEIINRSDE